MAGVSQGAGCVDGAALPSAGPLLPTASCQPELPALRAPLPPSSSPRRAAAFSQLPLLHFPPPAPVAMTLPGRQEFVPLRLPPAALPPEPPRAALAGTKAARQRAPVLRRLLTGVCFSLSRRDASWSRRAAPSQRWLTGRRLCWARLPSPAKASPGGSEMAFGLASFSAWPCCAGPRWCARTPVVVPSCGARAQSPAPPHSTAAALP